MHVTTAAGHMCAGCWNGSPVRDRCAQSLTSHTATRLLGNPDLAASDLLPGEYEGVLSSSGSWWHPWAFTDQESCSMCCHALIRGVTKSAADHHCRWLEVVGECSGSCTFLIGALCKPNS